MSSKRFNPADPFATPESTERWIREHIKPINVSFPALASLEKLHEVSVGLAIVLQDKQAELQGQYWILADDHGPPLIVASHWDSAGDRRAVLHGMRHLLRELGTTRYSVASEAWAVLFDGNDEARKHIKPLSLQHHPRRTELLMIVSIERDPRRRLSTMYDLVRNPALGTKAPPIKRTIKPDMDNLDGDLATLFDGGPN